MVTRAIGDTIERMVDCPTGHEACDAMVIRQEIAEHQFMAQSELVELGPKFLA